MLRAWSVCAFATCVAAAACGNGGPGPVRAANPALGAGDLPPSAASVVDDLLANDLVVRGAEDVNGVVKRLDLARGARRFSAKWKPMGPGGSEVQDGLDGNNAPRCEVAAWRLNRMLFGGDSTRRHLVAPTVVRAFHRDVPCDRACAGVPRLPELTVEATFPESNDHLVLGALTWWVDGVVQLEEFRGGLWDRRRFERNPEYRRSFSDLALFLYLIAHGDANYGANFLVRARDLGRIYSIDNGRAFDGVPYYTDEADPDWDPFKQLSPQRLVAPAFAKQTVARLAAIDHAELARALRIVSAIDMTTGRSVREPSADDSPVRELIGAPIRAAGSFERRGRGVFVGRIDGRPWVLLGIGERGIENVRARARALLDRLSRPGAPPLFEP